MKESTKKTITQKNSKYVKQPPKLFLPPKTTAEEEDVTAGQRRVNLLWEGTQGFIAICITLSVIFCQIKGIQSEILNNAFFLIISMYYIRTNHSLIGGTGPKPPIEKQQR